MLSRLARGRPRKIDLDHFRWAGADKKQKLDLWASRQQPIDDGVEFIVNVGDAGEITVFENGGGEARLGEDHHARRRLDEMRAGARADDEKERVLNLAVQPDDAGQSAEYFALAALLNDGRGVAGAVGESRKGRERIHSAHSMSASFRAGSCRRAARSLSRNCVALTT